MSLSPDVAPFVPKQPVASVSQPENVSQSPSWQLSANVAEFVPSWMSSGSISAQNQTSTRNGNLSMTPKTKKTVSKPRHPYSSYLLVYQLGCMDNSLVHLTNIVFVHYTYNIYMPY